MHRLSVQCGALCALVNRGFVQLVSDKGRRLQHATVLLLLSRTCTTCFGCGRGGAQGSIPILDGPSIGLFGNLARRYKLSSVRGGAASRNAPPLYRYTQAHALWLLHLRLRGGSERDVGAGLGDGKRAAREAGGDSFAWLEEGLQEEWFAAPDAADATSTLAGWQHAVAGGGEGGEMDEVCSSASTPSSWQQGILVVTYAHCLSKQRTICLIIQIALHDRD